MWFVTVDSPLKKVLSHDTILAFEGKLS